MKNCYLVVLCLIASLVVGCASYSWRSSIPKENRLVFVPTFRNESNVTELGNLATREILREFQREGTFRIASSHDDAVIEVQGAIKSNKTLVTAYDLRSDRLRDHSFSVEAIVSVVDRKSGKVLINNKKYSAKTTFLARNDTMTGERNASGRIAEELAQKIVDDVLSMKW